jgi:hypothetical protein
VENKVDPLVQVDDSYQHKTNATVSQNSRNIKENLKIKTRQIKDIITEKQKKDGKEKGCMQNSHVA